MPLLDAGSLRWSEVDPSAHAFEPGLARSIVTGVIESTVRASARLTDDDRDALERDCERALGGGYGAWVCGWCWTANEPPLLQAGDNAWQTWPQFYASLRGHADLRVDAVETFVSRYWMKQAAPSREPRLAFLVDADPASWLVVRAQVALAEALEARGSGTEIKDAATFSARAAASRTDAERVAMAEPGEAPPLVMLMRIARGTGDDTLGAQAYQQAVTNIPVHPQPVVADVDEAARRIRRPAQGERACLAYPAFPSPRNDTITSRSCFQLNGFFTNCDT